MASFDGNASFDFGANAVKAATWIDTQHEGTAVDAKNE